MRTLVIGGAGFVGSILCQHLLEEGHEVDCVDSLRYGDSTALAHLLGAKHFRFMKADIRDVASYRQWLGSAYYVIPLAALVGAPVCDRFPVEAEEVNYDAIRRICAELGRGQRLLWPASNSGYGATDGDSEVTEDSPLNPVSLYGRTKVDAEKAVLDRGDCTVFRLATVFGVSPRMRYDLLVNDWTRRLVKLKRFGAGKFSIYEPHFRRNYVHVRDVARAFSFALDCPISMEGVFNLGHPEADCSKWELATTICRTIGLDESVLEVDPEGRDVDQRNYKVSNKKILSKGFTFMHSLEDGVREVAQYTSLLTDEQIALMRNVL